MLIQALCEYYDILAKAGKMLPEGYSKVKVHYLVCLTPKGEIDEIVLYQDRAEVSAPGGKKKEKWVPREEELPERTEKPGIDANIVEHRPLYLFGLNLAEGKLTPEDRTGKARKSHEALVESNLAFLEGIDTPVVNAYRAFLENWCPEKETENKKLLALEKAYDKSSYIFCLSGSQDKKLHEDELLKKKWELQREQNNGEEEKYTAQCAVSGKEEPIARIHSKIKGVYEGLATGSVLVGFNNASENSYGLEQSYNSNISERAMKKYTEALNYLLSSDKHKVRLDDMTVVFWAMDGKEDYEAVVNEMLFGGSQNVLYADRTEEMLRALMKAAGQGSLTEADSAAFQDINRNVEFYILGLKPNSSRLALKFLYRRRYGEILDHIAKYQRDIQIREGRPPIPFYRIKGELLSPKSQNEKVNPALAAKLFESILYGLPYPTAFFETIIRRIRTDKNINEVRAGIVKAWINRNYAKKEEITMALNVENENQAYLCGRLFAVLEKLQQEAVGTVNRTIKDAYFASASATPALVFPKLIRLAQNHLNKVNRTVYFNKLIGEVIGKIKDEFPSSLSLQEQGNFDIGYYQQYQSFFEKTKTTEGKEEKEEN